MKEDKIIKRIKNLLAMGERSEGNENEARIAMERAYKLMAQYNIDRSEVLDEDNVESVDGNSFTRKRGGPWARQICMGIASLYFCKYYYRGGSQRTDTHTFVGTESNVAIAQMVSNYVMDMIDGEAKRKAISTPFETKTQYLNSFRNAAGTRIAVRCREMIAEAERGEAKDDSGNNFPVLASVYKQHQNMAEDWIRENVKGLRSRAVRMKNSSSAGTHDGFAAGNRANLRPSIN
jgi:hypothetical protein